MAIVAVVAVLAVVVVAACWVVVRPAVVAVFAAPLSAVRCAQAIALETRTLGLPSRLGVHFGGCEVRGEKLTGLNVHTAARVMSLAGPNEVVVSESVRDTLVGAEVRLEDRGAHVLKGVPGEWRVYAVGLS